MDINLSPDNIVTIRRSIYHDILTNSEDSDNLKSMSMDDLEDLMYTKNIQTIAERDRISVFNDLIGNLDENNEEKLLQHIFMNKLLDFNIFYQFITIFLSPCISSNAYRILPASLKADYENNNLEYMIEIFNDDDHIKVIEYFTNNPKFTFKNFDYDIVHSQNNKNISIEFIQL